MANYIFTAQASADLRHIISHIANDNPRAAKEFKTHIINACQKLGAYPLIGQERTDLTTKPIRFFAFHRNYMLIYQPETNPIRILRIYHAAREITSII